MEKHQYKGRQRKRREQGNYKRARKHKMALVSPLEFFNQKTKSGWIGFLTSYFLFSVWHSISVALCPLQWGHADSTTGQPGKSLDLKKKRKKERKKHLIISCLQETHYSSMNAHRLKMKRWEKIFIQLETKRAEVAILIIRQKRF